jgi:predicted SAM-dependent methyltransferase
MRIEFGSGGRSMDGWLNTEQDTCDITQPLRYPDNFFDMAYTSHVPEHLTSHEAMRFFQEVHRILKRGAIFRVVVPTLEKITDRAHALDLTFGHGHKMVFSKESLRDMLWAAGFDRGRISFTEKDPELDWHGKTIGEEKDNLESIWINARK